MFDAYKKVYLILPGRKDSTVGFKKLGNSSKSMSNVKFRKDMFEKYSGPIQTFKTGLIANVVSSFKPLTIFALSSVLDL